MVSAEIFEEQHRVNFCTREVPFAGPAVPPCVFTSPWANSPTPFPSWPFLYCPSQHRLALHAPSIPSCLPAWRLHLVAHFPSPMFPNSPQSVPFLCLQKENCTYVQNDEPCVPTPLRFWPCGVLVLSCHLQLNGQHSAFQLMVSSP